MAIVGGLLASLALSTPALAQFSPGSRSLGDRLLPALGNGGYDAQHYDVTLNYDPVNNAMLPGSQTVITMKATQGLSEFSLDLRAYTVSEVTIDGAAATTSRVDDKLVVTPAAGIANGRVFQTIVKFAGAPLEVIDPDNSTEGWARIPTGGFVVNEPMGAMGWFPSNNHPADKATYDYHVTIPEDYISIANGELTGALDATGKPAAANGLRTWNWSLDYPMATYLTTATVGKFDYTKWNSPLAIGKSGAPLELYDAIESTYSPEQKTAANTGTQRQDDIIKFMADALQRPYPFESHGVVAADAQLDYALESQTKSHFSSSQPNPVPHGTLAHEIAHQWFGDSIGPRTWDELWFNEGWATWWNWYWSNKENGGITTQQQFANVYANATPNWQYIPAALPGPENMFVPSFPTYNRSAAMLEGYRQIVGEPAFWAFQRALIDEFSYSTITTDAFIELAKRIARDRGGFDATNLRKLDVYFTQWLRTAGKPSLTPANFFLSSTFPGNEVTGTVPATLSLTLNGTPSFNTFVPGVTREYTTSTMANVISTAGNATLSVSAPGHLSNGAFTLPEPLRVELEKTSWDGPVSNDEVDVTFKQLIKETDPLRTGTYSKTLTFTLSTTAP
ncbi:M1 family metallopeptidase [Solirubrobacter sp. CPCC 204708]|uniref:Aminopeptidase N n=1 Tax=Solirubrobacter deserti TaxID=2282478 RepID=A0ABT4RGT9_9ACTN|nr:M1 family metallopeptidase [Solirubrobacter deserti]MBE2315404.1 M1 family metallopeptidase [Solirubrobacter deserti]MDA0137754.1 M1 family metallopeptidase [Solirubrobacter deserti]